jgi:hypothetical protein
MDIFASYSQLIWPQQSQMEGDAGQT